MNIKKSVRRAGIITLISLAPVFNSYAQVPESEANPAAIVQSQQTTQQTVQQTTQKDNVTSGNLKERLDSFLESLREPENFRYTIKYTEGKVHGEIEFRYSFTKNITMNISQIIDNDKEKDNPGAFRKYNRYNEETYRLRITDEAENNLGEIDKARVVFEVGYGVRVQHPANNKKLPQNVSDDFGAMYSRGLELVIGQKAKDNAMTEKDFDIKAVYPQIIGQDILDKF